MPRLLALVAISLALSGCVWSRLLDLQGQLKDFDRCIDPADEGAALLLRFRKPCVRASDVGYLLGGKQPTGTVERAGGGHYVSWLLRRDRADSVGLDIALGVPDLDEETLADCIRVPPEVLAFIPRERLLAMARALGSASVDRSRREAAAGVLDASAKPLMPGRQVVVQALGEPDHEERDDDIDRLTWRFRLVRPDRTFGKSSDLVLVLRGQQLLSARLAAPNFGAEVRFDGRK